MIRHVTFATLALAQFIAVAACAADTLDLLPPPGQKPLVIAHRSAPLGGAPENSLAWIDAAIGLGVDAIHINPQLTKDGGYVLMHDQTLNRMTDVEAIFPAGPVGGPTRAQRGGKDYVRDYTLSDLQKLELKQVDNGPAPGIPTLEEALARVDGQALVLLGLKSYEIESLANNIAEQEINTLLFLELYHPGTDQKKLRDLCDTTRVGAAVAFVGSRDYLADLDAIHRELGSSLKMVSVQSAGITEGFKAAADSLGIRVVIGGWRGPEDRHLVSNGNPGPWEEVLTQGFSALTDYPELVLPLLDR